jgi:hypothetical protein
MTESQELRRDYSNSTPSLTAGKNTGSPIFGGAHLCFLGHREPVYLAVLVE